MNTTYTLKKTEKKIPLVGAGPQVERRIYCPAYQPVYPHRNPQRPPPSGRSPFFLFFLLPHFTVSGTFLPTLYYCCPVDRLHVYITDYIFLWYDFGYYHNCFYLILNMLTSIMADNFEFYIS
jgi:hypothetical protein